MIKNVSSITQPLDTDEPVTKGVSVRDLSNLLEAAKKGFVGKMKEAPEFVEAVKLYRRLHAWCILQKEQSTFFRTWEDQCSAAAVSIPANLGEASARATHRQLLQYYQVAFGSAWELLALLSCCPVEVPAELIEKASEVSNLIGKRIERLVEAG